MKRQSTWDPRVAKIYRYMPPPGPPSASELAVYEKFIKPLKGKKGIKVLILGSTPGLRDLCLKYKIPHLCVDYHEQNFKIAGSVIKHHGVEELLVADWRQMKLPGKYDLILGDIAFGMVLFSDLDKILTRLQQALKKDGFIVHRTWMRKGDDFRGKKFEAYLKTIHPIRRKKIHPFTSLGIPFVLYFYDNKKDRVLFAQNIKKLNNFVKNGLLPKKDYDYFKLYWGNYKLPNYYPIKPRYEKKLRRYFKIKKILHGKDWFKDYALIYVLEKK